MGKNWKRAAKFYNYECTLTGERFRMKKEAKNPGELLSVKAYYELHPEKDDRPELIKKRISADDLTRASYEDPSPEDESEEGTGEASE